MKFLVDNALSPTVAIGLSAAGHDVIHVRDRGMSAAKDEAVLVLAEQEDRIVISADTDFGTILAMTNRLRPSVIQLRGHFPDDPQDQVEFILHHLASVEDDLNAGALVTYTPSRIRVRNLPI